MKWTAFLLAALWAGTAFGHGGGGGGGGCGGGMGFGGGGDSDVLFELPSVDETVKFAGVSLKVNRTKWSIGRENGDLMTFVGEDASIRVREVSDLALAVAKVMADRAAEGSDLLQKTAVRTDFGVPGTKLLFGKKRGFFGTQVREMNYFFRNPAGQVLCFTITPSKAYPDFFEARKLVNTLFPEKLARSRTAPEVAAN